MTTRRHSSFESEQHMKEAILEIMDVPMNQRGFKKRELFDRGLSLLTPPNYRNGIIRCESEFYLDSRNRIDIAIVESVRIAGERHILIDIIELKYCTLQPKHVSQIVKYYYSLYRTVKKYKEINTKVRVFIKLHLIGTGAISIATEHFGLLCGTPLITAYSAYVNYYNGVMFHVAENMSVEGEPINPVDYERNFLREVKGIRQDREPSLAKDMNYSASTEIK